MRQAMAGVVLGSLLGLAIVPASWAGNFFDVSDTGNVGIGTTSAGALLDVARPATSSNSELIDIRANGFTQTITSGLTNARFNFFNQYTLSAASAQTVTNGTTLYVAGPPTASGAGPATITTGSALRIAGGTVANTTNAYGLYVDAPTGATNNYAAVFSTGKVGIGTTAPDLQLDVRQSANTPAGQFRVDGTGIQTALQLVNRNTSGGAAGEGPELTFVGGAGSGIGPNIASIDAAWNGAATTDGYLTLSTRRGGSITEAVRIASSGNVGIGTTSPNAPLQVVGSGTGFDVLIGRETTTADTELRISRSAVNNGDMTIEANRYAQGPGNLILQPSGGNIGIGTTSPAYLLDVAGSAHASSFPTSSDIRLKKNVAQLTGVLPKLEKIKGVAFDWNSTYQAMGRATGHREVGLIAQEVEAVFPELVTTWGEQGYRAIDYGRLAGVLVEAIKEQQAEIRELRREIAAMKHGQ